MKKALWLIGILVGGMFGNIVAQTPGTPAEGAVSTSCNIQAIPTDQASMDACGIFQDGLSGRLGPVSGDVLYNYCRCLYRLGSCMKGGQKITNLSSCSLDQIFNVSTFQDLAVVAASIFRVLDLLNPALSTQDPIQLKLMSELASEHIAVLSKKIVP